jgi:predicted Zn-dependent peptidase
VLGLLASALEGSCEMRPEVVTRERNVVLSEIEFRMRGTVDTYDQLLASIYSPDHPYGHFLSGTPGTVSALTSKDACDYLRGRFTPGNASVVIAGGVTEARALAAADATLKPLASRATLPEVAVPPSATGLARAPARRATGLARAPARRACASAGHPGRSVCPRSVDNRAHGLHPLRRPRARRRRLL